MFVAREDWFKDHQKEAEFFLKVWERGIKEWKKHRTRSSPPTRRTSRRRTRTTSSGSGSYLDDHNWFMDSVYLDDEWIDGENKVFDLLKETGFMDEEQEPPAFEAVGAGRGR